MATTTTTYHVMKRPHDSSGNYELHVDRLGMFVPDEGEPAIYEDLQEAYTAAASLRAEFETTIKVVETTVRVVEYL